MSKGTMRSRDGVKTSRGGARYNNYYASNASSSRNVGNRPTSTDTGRNWSGGRHNRRQRPEYDWRSASDIPGYSYDAATDRYFRILPDSSGVVGHRQSDVRAKMRDAETTPASIASTLAPSPPPVLPLTTLMGRMALGDRTMTGMRAKRATCENMLRRTPMKPTSTFQVPVPCDVLGCEFLDVTADGTALTGCWSMGARGKRDYSKAFCLLPSSDHGRLKMGHPQSEHRVAGSAVVDMVMAPVDRDVTCLLYATATSTFSDKGYVESHCNVYTTPMMSICQEDNPHVISSPIYNKQLFFRNELYSCAWNSATTRIALGMTSCASLIDVVYNRQFRVSSRQKPVLSQAFSSDGRMLSLGLKGGDAVLLDLRMRASHVVASLPDCPSVYWLKPLKAEHQVIAAGMQGQLRLYDTRKPCVCVREYVGHVNSHSKLPSFVDHDENFLFAVGSDAVTRVWSIGSSGVLASVDSPSQPSPADFPRPVYSTKWGGREGTAALLIAVGPIINEYQLHLSDPQSDI